MPYKTPWLKDKNAGIVKIRNAVGDTTTQTGNPVSVDNEFGLGEVNSLAVALNPVQNLNGYDSPWIGGSGKNLLPPSTTQTSNGVKFTVNDDGTITATRTSSSTNNAEYDLTVPSSLYGKAVILNGCPSGGSDSGTYRMFFLVNGSRQATDYGNGATYTIPSSPTSCVVRINIFKDFNSTATFKPMIRLASVTDATYAPYENICPIYASNGKNLLQITATSQTVNGVTFTVNADGTVKANGTASSAAEFVIKSDVSGNTYAGMILSGCPNGGGGSTYRLFEQVQGSPWTYLASDGGSGVTIPTTTYATVRFVIRVESGVSVNNLVFKPMIRPASITDSTYVPYQSIVVTRTGKNLFNGQFAYHNADKYSPVLDGETYTVSSKSTGAHQINLQYITKTNTYYGDRKIVSEGDTFGKTTVTIPTDVKGVLIYVNGDASNSQHTAYDTQIELGSTATDYEPYQGNTYTINLNGTRYGGTVDLVTGVLTLTKGFKNITASDNIQSIGSSGNGWQVLRSSFDNPPLNKGANYSDGIICDRLKSEVGASSVADDICFVNTSGVLRFNLATVYADKTALFNAIGEINVAYPIEPQTIQLTPQQISLLTGINYISSSDEVTVTVTLPGWTSLIDPSKIKHDIYDLDAGNTTGRNLAGEMLRDRVAVKEKLNLEFPPIVADDYYAMLNLIKDQFFDVQYYSPFTGGKRVATMYVGDREGEPYYDYDVNDHANNMWTNVKFNFIER